MKNLKAAQWRAYAPIDLKIAKRFVLPYKLSSKFFYKTDEAKKEFLASEEGQEVVKKIKETFEYWLSPQCDIQDEELLTYLQRRANNEISNYVKLRTSLEYNLSDAAEQEFEVESLKHIRKTSKRALDENYLDTMLFDSVCHWRLGETMREPKNNHQRHGHDNGKSVNKGSGYGGINSVRIPSRKRPLSTWRNFYTLFGRWFEPSENDYKLPIRKV